MDNLKGLLRVIVDKIEDCESSLDREYRQLGEGLLAVDGDALSKTTLSAGVEDAREKEQSIGASLNDQARLEKLLIQLEDLNERISEKNEELESLQQEVAPHYMELARAVMSAAHDSAEVWKPFSRQIEQLRSLESDVRSTNRRLSESVRRHGEQSGFLGNALSAGRRLYLQGTTRAKSARADFLARRLGRLLCDSDEVTSLDNEALVDVMTPVLKYREARGRLLTHLGTLRNKAERVEKEIGGLTGGARPRRHIAHIETERSRTQAALSQTLRELGHTYVEKTLFETVGGRTLQVHVESISSLARELETLRDKRGRVEAAIELEILDRKIEAQNTRMRSLEATVRRANREIETITDKLKVMGRDRERLIEARGEEELLIQ